MYFFFTFPIIVMAEGRRSIGGVLEPVEDRLKHAVQFVLSGVSTHRAAAKYKVDQKTLWRYSLPMNSCALRFQRLGFQFFYLSQLASFLSLFVAFSILRTHVSKWSKLFMSST